MLIRISPDLKTEEIWATGVELASVMGHDREHGRRVFTFPPSKKQFVARFKNPVLMTDNWRIGKLGPATRDTLFSLFNHQPRVVEYDGVSVSWNNTHVNVWCPSIDTVLFAQALKQLFKKQNNFRTAVEIGCGSGFLSKFVLAKCPKLKSILINDINPFAIKCAKDNIHDARARFYCGDGLAKIKNKKIDLLICNPPYVPRPGSIDDNPYEGVGLLNYLLYHAKEHLNPGGVLVVNVSSLCADIVLKDKPALPVQLLTKMSVPLKVNNIMNNAAWLRYLTKKCGLKKRWKRGYEYWQELFIVALNNYV
jgi:precorrin-6B methylase 2